MIQRKRRETKKFRHNFKLSSIVNRKKANFFVCEKQWGIHWTRGQHQALLANRKKNQTI